MKRHSLVVAATLALLVVGCGRGGAPKGQPSEQQRTDLDNMAAKMDNEQVVDLPDDSLTVNDSQATATLNGAAPGNAAVAPAPTPVPANGVAVNSANGSRAR